MGSDVDLHLHVLYSILKLPMTLHMFDRTRISLSCESQPYLLTMLAAVHACALCLSVSADTFSS